MSLVGSYFALRFVKLLATRWEKSPAYEAGVVDEKGNFLLRGKTMTLAQRKTYGPFERLVYNFKRLVSRIPGGAGRFASLAIALSFLKEHLGEDIARAVSEELERMSEETPTNVTGNVAKYDAPLTKKVFKRDPQPKPPEEDDLYKNMDKRKKMKKEDAFYVEDIVALDEAFTNPYSWYWKSEPIPTQTFFRAFFKTMTRAAGKVDFARIMTGNAWDVAFTINDDFEETNEGDAFRIFATVIDVILDFVDRIDPSVLEFHATKSSLFGVTTGRVSLYKKMVQRYLPKGYSLKVREHPRTDMVAFAISKT